MNNIDMRERQLRRLLARHGLRLRKTPVRSWLRRDYGVGYMVTDNNTVKFGSWSRQYQGTLAETEDWATRL